MKLRWFPRLAWLALAGAAAAADTAVQDVAVDVDAPTVHLAPRAAARSFVQLPTLEFRFRLRPVCPAGFAPVRLTLGVADSRTSLDAGMAEELAARLTVPAAQLAPLPLSGFCTRDDDVGETATSAEELTIESAASVQVALLCASADEERLTFAATPLAVTLVCDAGNRPPD